MPNLIKLTNYPYQDYQVGEICDFGVEKNTSLVAFGRAVWLDEEVKSQPKHASSVASEEKGQPEEVVAPVEVIQEEEWPAEPETLIESSPTAAPKKKFLQNKLKEKVQQKTQSDSKSFWDRLK